MKHTVISHDVENAKATILFEHKDVVFEEEYNLKMIIPGSESILNEMGIKFTKTHQMTVIDKLVAKIERYIDEGVITPRPTPEKPVEEIIPTVSTDTDKK